MKYVKTYVYEEIKMIKYNTFNLKSCENKLITCVN